MSLQSLIAHNGVFHQKSKPVEKPQSSTTETQNSQTKIDTQIVKPESNKPSNKQTLENSEIKINTENSRDVSTTTETPIESDLANVTFFPGFGESIFALLIISPFLLFRFKKWLHR